MKETQSVMSFSWRWQLKTAINLPQPTFHPDLHQGLMKSQTITSALWSWVLSSCVLQFSSCGPWKKGLNCNKKISPAKKTQKQKGESLNSDTSDSQPCLNKKGRLSGQQAIQKWYKVLIYFQETLITLFKVLKKKDDLEVISSPRPGSR